MNGLKEDVKGWCTLFYQLLCTFVNKNGLLTLKRLKQLRNTETICKIRQNVYTILSDEKVHPAVKVFIKI